MIRMPTVELVAYTPNPVEICGRAAGICYDKEEKERYDNFIRRIVKRGHESVIEHANFTFKVTGVSRALTHQWVRHRICSFSQRSQRYCTEDGFDFVMPPLDYLKEALIEDSENIHGMPDTKKEIAQLIIQTHIATSQACYNALIGYGVRPEDARFVVPNACESQMVWTANARELRHFFTLRLSKHAQWEIRRMARLMWDLVVQVAPALFDDLWTLRGRFKEECPHYEKKGGAHWCGEHGEWMEWKCPMVCRRFSEIFFGRVYNG